MAAPANKEYDPEKSDFLHGRTEPGIWSRPVQKVCGCEGCIFGERYPHTCGKQAEVRTQ